MAYLNILKVLLLRVCVSPSICVEVWLHETGMAILFLLLIINVSFLLYTR